MTEADWSLIQGMANDEKNNDMMTVEICKALIELSETLAKVTETLAKVVATMEHMTDKIVP